MTTLDLILATVRHEFTDLLSVESATRATLRMGMALLLGAAIGWERELRDADAGLRTHMLVALGSALVVLVCAESGMPAAELGRVVQGVIAGIGFLGAGTMIKSTRGDRVHGLTTAASIWATAAVGCAVGLGREATAVLATVFVLIVLAVLRRVSRNRRGEEDDRGV